MAVQKSKKTRSKRGMIRSHDHLSDLTLSTDPVSGERHLRHQMTSDGKKAVSKFKILKTYNSFTHAEILISTGRMHQIRVQSANLNHPILNDKKYGLFSLNKYIAKETSISRLALHARSISFSDLGGNNVSYEAPKNNEFDILLSKLDNLTVKF